MCIDSRSVAMLQKRELLFEIYSIRTALQRWDRIQDIKDTQEFDTYLVIKKKGGHTTKLSLNSSQCPDFTAANKLQGKNKIVSSLVCLPLRDS